MFRTRGFSVGQAGPVGSRRRALRALIVHHPGAVAIVPVDANRRVTLVRQYRAAVDRMVLEAPAGTCDVAGEAREATARRELAEEAGLLAGSMEVLIGTFNTPGSATSTRRSSWPRASRPARPRRAASRRGS